jgi:hypothetical protein
VTQGMAGPGQAMRISPATDLHQGPNKIARSAKACWMSGPTTGGNPRPQPRGSALRGSSVISAPTRPLIRDAGGAITGLASLRRISRRRR